VAGGEPSHATLAAMQIDTPAVRQLRDRILGASPESALPQPGGDPTPEQEAALDRVGPLVEVMVLMMAADGEIRAAEQQAVGRAVLVLTGSAVPPAVVEALLDRMERTREEQGLEARLEAIGTQLALRPGDAEAAFSLAAAVGVSDGEVVIAEESLIARLRRYLGISEARARALLEGAPPVPAR